MGTTMGNVGLIIALAAMIGGLATLPQDGSVLPPAARVRAVFPKRPPRDRRVLIIAGDGCRSAQ